jgi:hypothetical protein
MADFRKWFLAFAVVALLISFSTAASAQNNVPGFSCNVTAVPVTVRAEGISELVGDLVLNCTGGVPTLLNQPIPLSNVSVSLNTNITSRLYSGNLSEGIIAIDEPYPGGQPPTPANTAPTPGATSTQLGCQAVNSTNCAIVGVGTGPNGQFGINGTTAPVGINGPYNGTPGRFNVFQGFMTPGSAPGTVFWNGVPIDAPGTSGTRVIRVTNIRANACQLGVSSTLIPTQIVMLISINGSQQLALNQQQNVALIAPGLITSAGNRSFVQCVNINGDLLSGTAGQIGTIAATATEGFGSSFKVRSYSQLFSNLTGTPVSLSPTGAPPNAPSLQNIFGFPYNTESGYVTAAGGAFGPTGTVGGAIGLADQGTQIQFVIKNVGAGISIFAPNTANLVQQGTSTVTGRAVLVGSGGGGGSSQLTVSGTTASAVYEVYYANANITESLPVAFSVAAIANPGQGLPALGQATVNISFAPISTVQTASSSAPIPRFCDTSVPRNFFAINPCTCNLLFPFVTNQAGFDTGIALANTSLDPFGTSTQQGPVTLNYYGNTTGGGAAPPAQKTQVVTAGTELIFTLYNGGNYGVTATPGFQGYIITVANFQYCHAFAFISDAGAQRLAEGYLAIQLDVPGLNRTGVLGENEGH